MRWLLGVMEAGFFPGVSYYLSWYVSAWHCSCDVDSLVCSWYKHSEYGIRIAVFFSGATVSGAFGGLLAVSSHSPPDEVTLSSSLPEGGNIEYGWRRW